MEEKQIFQIFLDEMIRIFGFDVAYIMQREGDSFFIDTASARLPEYDAIHQRMRSYFNLPQNRPSIDEKEGPDMALTMAAANKMPLYFYDIQTFKDAPMKEKDKKAIEVMQVPIRTVVHIPILYQDQAVGILDLFSYEDNLVSLTDNELEMITNLCTFIPSILYNSQLHLQLEKQKKEVDDKNRLIKAKNRQLMDELKLARQIQENLIPKNPPSIPGISLDSFYKPMEDVGGDFFDFIQIREPNLLGIFISDVSGHGVPAALITSMLKTLIETAGEERLSPAALLGYINQKILNQTNSNFLTAFYGIFNIEKSTLTYARASHNYPILMRENRLIELTSRGKMLGVLSDLEFEEKTVQLEKGDKILFYTDGLTEAINPEGKEFGDILPEILLSHKDKPLALFLNSLYYHLLHFREDYLFEDDVCVVGMEIH
jgi:serine phosphatase RsbU (regulator of sigma subunit)